MSQSSAVTERDKERAEDVLERMTAAIESLCVGEGDVRSRLEDAMYQLVSLREEDFPGELQSKFREIMEQSAKYDASDLHKAGYIPLEALSPGHEWYEGRLHSTMRRIRRSTGAKIARDIWELFSELRSMIGEDG